MIVGETLMNDLNNYQNSDEKNEKNVLKFEVYMIVIFESIKLK